VRPLGRETKRVSANQRRRPYQTTVHNSHRQQPGEVEPIPRTQHTSDAGAPDRGVAQRRIPLLVSRKLSTLGGATKRSRLPLSAESSGVTWRSLSFKSSVFLERKQSYWGAKRPANDHWRPTAGGPMRTRRRHSILWVPRRPPESPGISPQPDPGGAPSNGSSSLRERRRRDAMVLEISLSPGHPMSLVAPRACG
jgi:hypothetical protein